MCRATGLRQATAEQRSAVPIYTGVRGAPMAVPDAAQQALFRIIDQGHLGACVGCSMAAIIESVWWEMLSWLGVWRDARRRDGTLDNPDVGTWFTSAVESVTRRGIDREEPGEWLTLSEMTEPDDLDSEMDAADRRQVGTERWRVPDGDLDSVCDALTRGIGVGIATGVRSPYFAFFGAARRPDQTDLVLGTSALGGHSSGHEQRIVAFERVAGVRQFLIQNSWGAAGGAHLPDGTFQLGLARVDEAVIRAAWDVDCIRIVR